MTVDLTGNWINTFALPYVQYCRLIRHNQVKKVHINVLHMLGL